MATIKEMAAKIPGVLTIPEIEAYGDNGIIRTISKYDDAKVGENNDEKQVLSFEEDKKTLVINKTRSQQLADLFGAAVDPAGQKVKLVVRNTPVGSKKMNMINIEAAA